MKNSVVTISGEQGKLNFARTEEWIKSFSSHYTDVKLF